MTKSSGTFCFHSPFSMSFIFLIWIVQSNIQSKNENKWSPSKPLCPFHVGNFAGLPTLHVSVCSCNQGHHPFQWWWKEINPILGGWVVDCGVHLDKHSWIFQKRLTAWIWDFLTFKSYYLGLFSQNFRSASSILWKLESFCRSWLDKSCLVAKMQNFLPYQYLTFCQAN